MTAVQRPRDILGALPLSLFYPDPNTLPSPISLPARAGPSYTSSSASTSASTSTLASTPTSSEKRKRTQPDPDVPDTVKRLRSRCTVTPKDRAFMERDELGTGRSPARRLFVNDLDGASRGITGAISLGPTSPAIHPSPRASSSRSQRTSSLAPSPPISTSNTPRSTPKRRAGATALADGESVEGTPTSRRGEIPADATVNVHDIGFSIYADAESSTSSPPRRRSASTPPPSSAAETSALDTTREAAEEDKENVRPTTVATLALPYLASPGPSRPRSRLRESAINLEHDSPVHSPKGTPRKSTRTTLEDAFGVEEEEDVLRMKATRSGYRSSPRRAAVGRI